VSEDREWNWDLPGVKVPMMDDGTHPDLTPEQFVVWFRTQSTASQIRTAATILEVKPELARPVKVVPKGAMVYDAQSLRNMLVAVQDSLRSILEDTREIRVSKRRAALLTERIIAVGVAIKEMGL
jgi:hypothetical protein